MFKFSDKLFHLSIAGVSPVEHICRQIGHGWNPFVAATQAGDSLTLPDGSEVRTVATVCEYGGTGRLGWGHEECRCTDVQRLPAGSMGSVTVCAEHAEQAGLLVDEQLAAERSGAMTLRAMIEDERRMAR